MNSKKTPPKIDATEFPAQAKCYDYIVKFGEITHTFPTLLEISIKLKLSRARVGQILKILVESGYIVKIDRYNWRLAIMNKKVK